MAGDNITILVITGTFIFLIAPAFIVVYVIVYNNRKKKHEDEKKQMEKVFTNEIVKTRHEVREQTMQTIGADLHDNVGQLLSLTALTLKSISYNNFDTIPNKVNDAIDLTAKSIQEMRLLGKLLQGEQLVGMGLQEAVKQEIQWFIKTGQYQIKFSCQGVDDIPVNNEKDLILFRILQEAMNNIVKHANASEININLVYENHQLKLSVADNGIGFPSEETSPQHMGMGFHNIRKRTSMILGETRIESTPGHGTTITVLIPYP